MYEIFQARRPKLTTQLKYLLRKPKFFVACVYGVVFIILGNMAGNALFFGEFVLEAAGLKDHHAATRGLAVLVTTFACLIHGVWRRGGIILNNILAVIKIGILLLIIVLGITALGNQFEQDGEVQNFAAHNMAPDKSFANAPTVTHGYVESILAVIFAYGGYNQANYVSSD